MFKVLVTISLILSVKSQTDVRFSSINTLYNNAYMSINETCQLSNDQEGICKELINCESARKLFAKKQTNQIQHCGFHGRQRFVCCPKSKKFTKALCKKGIPQGVPGLYFKITNGDNASPGEFPFQAALGRRNIDGEISFNCGGSLVSDDVIVSAAHCFIKESNAPTMARLGRISLDLSDPNDENEAVDIDIQTIKIHPQYSSRSRHHDIALLKLKSPVKFTNEIKPICLSSSDIDVPKNLTITGFGSTEYGMNLKSLLTVRLQKGFVQEFSQNECVEMYKSNGKVLIDGQYCANSYEGIDACQGDSGGPLSYENKSDHAHYLYGVISFGTGCGSEFPAIYTKVNKYLDWIGDVMLQFES